MSGWWSSGDPADCMWYPRHLPQVVVTHRLRDGWKPRFWIACYECDLRLGPYLRGEQAHAAQRELEATPVTISPRKERPLPSKATTTAEQKIPELKVNPAHDGSWIELDFPMPGRSGDCTLILSVTQGRLEVYVNLASQSCDLSGTGGSLEVVVPAEVTPDALVAITAWLEQLPNTKPTPSERKAGAPGGRPLLLSV